ncbi:MAG TPA: cytochrome c biogenesis protein CcsA [Anaeromyxobacter sp.]|nr:cytochrome c biogenesis protein CcsA [Anaeromyxobacter sp.]
MSIAILRAAVVLYVASAALYLAYFSRPRHARLATVGFWALTAAFVVHAAAIGAGCREFGGMEFFTLHGGVVLAAWLGAGAYLVLQRIYRVPTLGAFVLPLVLLVLVPAALADPAHPDVPPEVVRHAAFHVVAAILSLALFGIAFGVSVMYLLQEREVKGKRFGALFSRLPSLESLDRLNQRLVRAGFAVFTVALLAGTLNATVVWKSAWSWDPQQITSVLVWLLFGAMVELRRLGWHGRRYAVLTLVGFLVMAGAMGGLRAFPGATRHAGNYGTEAGAGGAP